MDSPQPTVSAEEAFRLANGPLEGIYAAIDSMKALNVTVPVESAIVLLQAIITLRTQTHLTGNPVDTDEHKIDNIVAFFGTTPCAWFLEITEDDPRVTCDYDHFFGEFNTYCGAYGSALKAKHAFNTMRQARRQAPLEYIQAFRLATASLPHRVSEEDRVDQCRRSLQPSVIKSLGHRQQFAIFAALITAVNHAELLEDHVHTQQPGYPRGQWVNASLSNSPRGNKWDNTRNPSTSRPDAGKQPERQASQPPPGPPRPADRPPNAVDVDNHQWSTSPAGGQPFLAELQDLPDHKLGQKSGVMTLSSAR
ncbi:hypothetical protein RI367_008766 [Sorochytrium milnesiophthora]